MASNGRDSPHEFTDAELVSAMMGGTIEFDIDGEPHEFQFRSQKISMTNGQAKILVDCLSQYETEYDLSQEVARQTQTTLMDRFGIDDVP